MSSAKTARWLDLIAFLLQHRYPVVREELFRKVRGYLGEPETASEVEQESARRKFERDKDELRALGIAIETVSVPGAATTTAWTRSSPPCARPTTAQSMTPGCSATTRSTSSGKTAQQVQ